MLFAPYAVVLKDEYADDLKQNIIAKPTDWLKLNDIICKEKHGKNQHKVLFD